MADAGPSLPRHRAALLHACTRQAVQDWMECGFLEYCCLKMGVGMAGDLTRMESYHEPGARYLSVLWTGMSRILLRRPAPEELPRDVEIGFRGCFNRPRYQRCSRCEDGLGRHGAELAPT